LESNPSTVNWSILDSFESALLEPELDLDLGDGPLHEFLVDQDVGSVSLCDSPRAPVFHRAPYKQLPNFGDSKTRHTRPLLTVVCTAMECEEVEASRTDSPPTQASGSVPNSPKGAALRREEQGILLGELFLEADDKENSPVLALPRALVARQYWVSQNTNLRIGNACGVGQPHLPAV